MVSRVAPCRPAFWKWRNTCIVRAWTRTKYVKNGQTRTRTNLNFQTTDQLITLFPMYFFVNNLFFLCFQSIFMFPIHVFIESFAIYILKKSNLFKFKLLQKWFSGIVARLDRFHEKLLRHAIFKWGPVTEKFSNWEFSFFSFLISTVEVTFVQIWANSDRKKSYF